MNFGKNDLWKKINDEHGERKFMVEENPKNDVVTVRRHGPGPYRLTKEDVVGRYDLDESSLEEILEDVRNWVARRNPA